MSGNESFSWKKFFVGVFNPMNTAKIGAFALHIALWVLLIFAVMFAFAKVKNYFSPSKAVASPLTVTENAGSIETGSDKRWKLGVINF